VSRYDSNTNELADLETSKGGQFVILIVSHHSFLSVTPAC